MSVDRRSRDVAAATRSRRSASKTRRWRRRYGLPALGAAIIVIWILVAAARAAARALQSPRLVDVTVRLRPPSALHWLGTDALGRDVFSRLLYGARISLFAGIVVVLLGAVIGTLVGGIAAYARRRGSKS